MRPKASPIKRVSTKKLLALVFVVLIIPATVAYAGFFSMFSDVFSKVHVFEKPINSQNIALLSASPALGVGGYDDLYEVNTVDGASLLPDSGPEGALADVDEGDGGKGTISIYVVREGDSLGSIAQMYNVSVNTILWANNMARGAKLTVGQTLVILPVTGVEYAVKKGDTIESIAKRFRGDPEEIRSYNGLNSGTLLVGTVLIVPDGEMPSIAKPTTKPASSKLRGTSGPNFAGYFQSPLASYKKSQGLHGYNGVDLVQYSGAPVFASADGDVVVAREGGYNGGYGNYVVIQHSNGTQTLYAHLSRVHVSAGQRVLQGVTIGTLGNTGRSTGAHLHFEVRGARNPFAD